LNTIAGVTPPENLENAAAASYFVTVKRGQDGVFGIIIKQGAGLRALRDLKLRNLELLKKRIFTL
jgi:hypothetical protein